MAKRSISMAVVAAVLLAAACGVFAAENPDVIKLKKNVDIAREMTVNDVIVIDGDLNVYGRVEGDIVVIGGVVSLKNGSRVNGNIMAVGQVVVDPAAEVSGEITRVYMPKFIPSFIDLFSGGWVALWAVVGILALIGFLCLSLLVVVLAPQHLESMVGALENSFLSMFLRGLLWSMMVVPFAVFLIISVIGIVLIPLEFILVALALFAGYVASAIFIGNKVSRALSKGFKPFVSVIVGLVILFAVGLVPVIGVMVKAVFLIAGFGAVMTSRFGTVKNA